MHGHRSSITHLSSRYQTQLSALAASVGPGWLVSETRSGEVPDHAWRRFIPIDYARWMSWIDRSSRRFRAPVPERWLALALALACDVFVCAPSAAVAAPAHGLGLTSDYGLMWLLPQTIDTARARELLMFAEPVQAARVEAIGLVHRLLAVAKINEEVQALAARPATRPRVAQGLTKRGLRSALGRDYVAMLEWESRAQASLSRRDDAREGVRSILDKRKNNFGGC